MELTTFNKTIEKSTKKSSDAGVLRPKRKHVPKRSWSPSDSISPKKSKTMDTKMEKKSRRNKDSEEEIKKLKPPKKPIDSSPSSSDSSHISESEGDEKTPPQCIVSPTKDDLKRQIAILEAEKAKKEKTQEEFPKLSLKMNNVLASKNLNDFNKSKATDSKKTDENKVSPEILPESNDTEEKANSADLFPPEFDGGKMTNIGNSVYCRNVIYDSATGASKKATHIARRLIEGVFTHESLMKYTLTGQAPRGKDTKSNVAIRPLNKRGKDAILDFAIRYATTKNWPKQDSTVILKEMGQRITEYKRNHNHAIENSAKKDN
ncbi:titin homolog [Cotesia glomerata]|uniref:BEN domain-containing protein n=1 Tax=Cotesia glomerata TaxID=32391 RepID=A0AAV7IGU1_COTGL|nr:titin homolog [Cotesia glomerata]KAH0560870.1 hypothetical protein KQX54_009619 [Cotesia glomerata]